MKDKYIDFDVDFRALIKNDTKDITPEVKSEAIFAQSSIFVEAILTAVYLLNYEEQSIGKNTLEIVRTCETLASIGLEFHQEMMRQFYETNGILEANKDEK